jgi:hypothetical protein
MAFQVTMAKISISLNIHKYVNTSFYTPHSFPLRGLYLLMVIDAHAPKEGGRERAA